MRASMLPVQTYDPIQTLKPVAPDVWLADGPIIHMAMPIGSMPFPTRMVAIRLPSGELWIWSPIEGTEALWREIDALGPVAHLVAPNFIHYAHVPAWKARYPKAETWASPGVEARAAKQRIEVAFDHRLGDEPPSAWADTIDQLAFAGSNVLDEVVFFHQPTRTLILADLIENFEPDKLGGVMRVLTRLGGVQDPDGATPKDVRLTFWGGHAEAKASLDRMLAWDPERVIMAHGRWYPENGTEELRRAFRWIRD